MRFGLNRFFELSDRRRPLELQIERESLGVLSRPSFDSNLHPGVDVGSRKQKCIFRKGDLVSPASTRAAGDDGGGCGGE